MRRGYCLTAERTIEKRSHLLRLLFLALLCTGAMACEPEKPPVPPGKSVWPVAFVENAGQIAGRVPNPRTRSDVITHYAQGDNVSLGFWPGGVRFVVNPAPEQTLLSLEPSAVAMGSQTLSRNSGRLDPNNGRIPPDTVPEDSSFVFGLRFADANPMVLTEPEQQQEAVRHYLRGSAVQPLTGVESFGRLVYRDLWPGIDLIWEADINQVKYRFELAPGADPAQIRLVYDDVDQLALREDGALLVQTPVQDLVDAPPVAWQDDGFDTDVAVDFQILSGDPAGPHVVGFALGSYDPNQPLVVDPGILVYAGFLGGGGHERAWDVAVDEAGVAYVVGTTNSPDFPFTNGSMAIDTAAFLARISPDGTTLLSATYLEGCSVDIAYGVDLDMFGRPVVVGSTRSPDFPTTPNGYDIMCGNTSTCDGGQDAFLVKLQANGAGMLYGSYLGGAENPALGYETALDVACEGHGLCVVTGFTSAPDFPTKSAFQASYAGQDDIFVAAFDTSLSGPNSLRYSTYFGGAGYDAGHGVALHEGHAFVTGAAGAASVNFPTKNAALPDQPGTDAFLAKFDPTGGLDFSTHWGGSSSGSEFAWDVTTDSDGNAYIAGVTRSSDFPVHSTAFDKTIPSGISKGFVAKFTPDGQNLYSSYIGGLIEYTWAKGIAVGEDKGYVYVTGVTRAPDFPITNTDGVIDDQCGSDGTCDKTSTNFGIEDFFLAQIDPSFSKIRHSTFLGGADFDLASALALYKNGIITIAGETRSSDFTTTPTVWDDSWNGGILDAVATRVNWTADIQGILLANDPLQPGSVPTFEMIGKNHGPLAAQVVLESSVELVGPLVAVTAEIVDGVGTCNVNGAFVVCNFDYIDPGKLAWVRVTVEAAPSPSSSEMHFAVNAIGSEADPDLTNQFAAISLLVPGQ